VAVEVLVMVVGTVTVAVAVVVQVVVHVLVTVAQVVVPHPESLFPLGSSGTIPATALTTKSARARTERILDRRLKGRK